MAFYPEFAQHPSKPHQCIWINDEGVRCRSYAMRNQFTCYHHQTADMPEVMSNDPFPLPRADNFENIQMAVAEILERIAENRMDPKRASALLNGLQIASSNLHRRNAAAAAATRLLNNHPDPTQVPASTTHSPHSAGCPMSDACLTASDVGIHLGQAPVPCHPDPEHGEAEEPPPAAWHSKQTGEPASTSHSDCRPDPEHGEGKESQPSACHLQPAEGPACNLDGRIADQRSALS